MDITPRAKEIAERIFTILAEAEAKAHGTELDEVHFHEVGAVDSIVDIVAVAVCLDNLNITDVIATELCEGHGFVRCQHGIIPVPVPAVVNIAEKHKLSLRITDTEGELVTPTGAAIIAAVRSMDKLPKKFSIEKIGIETEKVMFEATENVNTHKGMIFLLGIVIVTAARALYEEASFNDIQPMLKNMCKDILKDFENIKNKTELTHGEKLYKNYGFTGVRGEVKEGLDIIFNGSLNVFEDSIKKNNDMNLASLQTLIFLMGKVMDSTIVHRHDIHMLRRVKREAEEFFAAGGVYSKLGRQTAENMEKAYIKDKISPGGSADLLAVTIFLYKLKKFFF